MCFRNDIQRNRSPDSYSSLNPLISEFPKLDFPSLSFDMSIVVNRGVDRMTNSVAPDETAHTSRPSHLDLHCSH